MFLREVNYALGGCIYEKKTPNHKKILTILFFVVLGVLNNILKVYQSLTTRKV